MRARPLNHEEEARGAFTCIEVDAEMKHITVLDPDDKMGGLDYLRLNVTKDKAYTFDHAFGAECTSEEDVSAPRPFTLDRLRSEGGTQISTPRQPM